MFYNGYFNIGFNPFIPFVPNFGMPQVMFGYNPFGFMSFSFPIRQSFPLFNYYAHNTNSYYADYSYNTDSFERTTNNVRTNVTSIQQKTMASVSTDANGNLQIEGYNAEAGQKLADIALKNAGQFHNHCAGHVESDFAEAGLGSVSGSDAYQMFGVMDNNPKFKKLETTNVDVTKLPAGCVPVYDKNVAGYGDYGHIEIALGDGRAASDGITEEIKQSPNAIYAPVYA